MAAIETNALTKRYSGTLAVDNLDITVFEGTVYGFLGPNGSGKTTTMKMLTALTPPTSGRASINGASIRDRNAVTRQIGYLPEQPPLYPELTAHEQLDLAADLRDLPSSYATKRIESLLDRLQLHATADEPIADYSKGMRQKTALIQAILHEPAVVFLDEPTAGLDPRAARTLRNMIAEISDSGSTIFLSTHILPVVDELADTVGVLYDGQLVAEDSPAELKRRVESSEQATLEDAFLNLTREDTTDSVKGDNG